MAAVLPPTVRAAAAPAAPVPPAAPVLPTASARTGLLRGAATVFTRDLRVSARRRADTLAALAFFAMVSSLFPLGIGPEPQALRAMAGGVLWIAALLASLLAMARLFSDDHADGTLEQLLLSPHPLPLLVLGKVAAHWVGSGGLLTLAAPVIAVPYGLGLEATAVLVAGLFLGTPVLSLLGAVAAALTVGLRGAALLLALLVLPLCVPVLVFGAGAVDAAQAGQSAAAHLSLLGAALLASLALAPLACAAALRISLEA